MISPFITDAQAQQKVQDAYNILDQAIVTASTGATGKSIVPTDIPTGTGIASWTATQPGPYPNHGGVVVGTNSFAIISRDAAGVFSISQTALDLTTYAKTTDLNAYTRTNDLEEFIGVLSENLEIDGVIYPFAIVDPVSKKASVAINQAGKFVSFAHPFLQMDNIEYLPLTNDEYVYVIIDQNNKIAFAIYKDGTVFNKLAPTPTTAVIKNVAPQFADLNYILLNGQSLGGGYDSMPALTTADNTYGNKMLSVGTKSWNNTYGTNPSARPSVTVIGLKENTDVNVANGETIGSGFLNALKAKVLGIFSPTNPDTVKPDFIFSYTGEGGRYLRELNKVNNDATDSRAASRQSNGGYYNTGIDDITRAKAYATTNNLTFNVSAVCWMQGEAEGGLKINRWDAPLDAETFNTTNKADIKQLKDNYIADIMAITGQRNRPLFLMYKTGNWTSGRSQFELMKEDSDIYIVSPLYYLPNAKNKSRGTGGSQVWGDSIHISNDAERWLGEQFAKVSKRVLIDSEDWKPVYPISATKSTNGLEVYVRFNVPRPPLVFDTDFMEKAMDLGFIIRQDGSTKGISNVALMGSDIVKITLSSALVGTEFTVSYGRGQSHSPISKPILSTEVGVVTGTGFATTNILFAGDITAEFIKAGKDGVFRINKTDGSTNRAVIRSVTFNGTNTVLNAENREIDGTLSTGTNVHLVRFYAWGNLRDSDNEKSIYSFGDVANKRTGNYPLWNWCLDFTNIKIT